jgi:hypothetical protein
MNRTSEATNIAMEHEAANRAILVNSKGQYRSGSVDESNLVFYNVFIIANLRDTSKLLLVGV